MQKVHEYRKRAAECRDLSRNAPTTESREHYRQLAEIWDRLADERLSFFVPKDLDDAG